MLNQRSTHASPTRRLRNLCSQVSPGGASAESEAATAPVPKGRVYQLRKKHFSKAQSISYENTDPLLIVRGERQYLYDEAGHQYLDTRNNVGHVGHSNKRVAAAVAAQVAVLNTNTRYLHQNISLLAEKLAATLPDPLEVCFFVNSGSEVAVGETVILLHPPLPLVVISMGMERGCRKMTVSSMATLRQTTWPCGWPGPTPETTASSWSTGPTTVTPPPCWTYRRTSTSTSAARAVSRGSSRRGRANCPSCLMPLPCRRRRCCCCCTLG